ncbi:MAG TPA: hypothetical protein VG433_05635 [Pirellulales bacterium]|nr:hypothetical protein [Pirellulales bacterium]
MRRSQHIWRGTWLSVLWMAATVIAAEPGAKHDALPPLIEEVLEQTGDFDVDEMPLTDFVALLKERYRIPVVLDRGSLEDAGVALDAKVGCQLKQVSLRSAITWALHAHSMDWVVHDGVLLLTTRDVVDSTMTTMVHDVSDFVDARGEKEEADAVMKRLEQLAGVVEATVLPGSWTDADGEASIKPLEIGAARVLVVYQNRRGHEAVAMLLDELAYCAEEPTPGSPKRPDSAHTKVTCWRRASAR